MTKPTLIYFAGRGRAELIRLVLAELRKLVAAAPEQRAALREELTATTLPRWLGYFHRLLESNRGGSGFLVGDSVSVADLALWYLFELMRDNGFGEALAKQPALVAFADRIGKRPRIVEYLKSPRRYAFVPLPT